MLSYELAKKIQDSGFEYKPRLHAMILPDNSILTLGTTDEEAKDGIYEPLLSELIEACGDFPNQFSLYGRDKDRWETSMIPTQIFGALLKATITEYGDTPEIAVAKLWLELNKK